jgi:hypothetical protein
VVGFHAVILMFKLLLHEPWPETLFIHPGEMRCHAANVKLPACVREVQVESASVRLTRLWRIGSFPEGEHSVEIVLQENDHDDRDQFGKVLVPVKLLDRDVKDAR